MVGKAEKMKIVIPGNEDVEGYDESNILYRLYFDLENMIVSEKEELTNRAIDYLDKASLVPTVITINDEALIVNARTAYNLLEKEELEMLKQNYDQDYLDNLDNNLLGEVIS